MTFSRSQFLAISSLFLLVWFRFESSFHSHFLLNLLGPLIAIVLFFVLWKSPKDNNRLVLGVLWMLITAILITDCVQTALFSKYSDARFEKKIHEVTEQVKNRTREQLEILSKSANNVKKEL